MAQPPTMPPTGSGPLRPRVVDLLSGHQASPLALVVAPAGYGKSIVLAHYADSFAARGKVISWRPYRDTREAAPLLDRLMRKLLEAGPDGGHSTAEPPVPATVESVLTAVERRAGPVLMLVDDVHLVHGTPVEDALEELALLAPPNLRIVLAGRRRPSINLARHELSGTVVVTADQLAHDEAEFRQALATADPPGGAPATAREYETLSRLTRGWPVALRLCLQVPRRDTDRAGAVLASAAVRGYLDREVLGVLPGRLAEAFAEICRTSQGPWLTDDGSGVLDELEDGYGLVSRRTEGRYDCVPLLREHLRLRAAAAPTARAARPAPLPAARPAAQDSPGPLTLRCFGRFEATLGDRVLDWRTTRPRVRALARLLAVHAGQPVHRERLMAALWPETPERNAGRGLQVAVSALRTFLEPGIDRGASRILLRSGEAYMLSPQPGGSCDVQRFEAAVTTGMRLLSHGSVDQAAESLGLALHLCTGELLPEDGPAEWVVPLREYHRAQLVRAALTLAEVELGRDRPQTAVAAAHHALSVDPFQDAAWRLLVLAHRRAGDPVAAHQAQLRHARILEELGVRPPGTAPEPDAATRRGLAGLPTARPREHPRLDVSPA
ncbi:BTAD domain-containing putative transcriptional regulator [Streptomyces sp. NPDC046977]|uniref:BTAD domain-containing putative transcriptional regulator n=1 Tax=Streptomyces sp. NPDC046977 TaxID=3154703 RepID=UPI0033D80E7A